MKMININVGLLGHVDSGKTSLAKALSQVSSTASFDKHPQALERGITIDLGFSSFKAPPPSHLGNYDTVQFTLVDCPGHASLISTVIGGAQIIDLMILVIDATKGVQTQTAECMVIAEITGKKLIVVINKTDLLKSKEHEEKIKKKMRLTVDSMAFKGCPIVCASAQLGDVQAVISCLQEVSFLPERNDTAPFLMAVDHCFGIQGKGTVLTGTILQGKVQVNEEVEIPAIKATKKVKSIQIFRESVDAAKQGDRVGMCVTQFDPKLLERGLVSKPNLLHPIYATILDLNRVRFYSNPINSHSKFHISIGHETVIATVLLFEAEEQNFNFDSVFRFLSSTEEAKEGKPTFVLLEFEHSVIAAPSAWAIGARLDLDKHTPSCRMAFYGRLIHSFHDKNYKVDSLSQLNVYKEKVRQGIVDRAADEQTVIGRNMFQKTTDMSKFMGMQVTLSTGETGIIESAFGQSGKFKVRIPDCLKKETLKLLNFGSKGKIPAPENEVIIHLKHLRYMFDPRKRMIQR